MAAAVAGDSTKPSSIFQLLLVLVLAISAWIQLTVVNKTVVDVPIRADASDYFSYAFNLREYGVYSSAQTWRAAEKPAAPSADKVRAPGYPLFLAMVAPPTDSDAYLHRVSLWQAAFGVLSVALAYLIAANCMRREGALAVAALTAVNPHLATISTFLLSESLFMLLLLASVLATIKALSSNKGGVWLLSGLLWGGCCLVRPTMQLVPALLLGLAVIIPQFRQFRVGGLVAFLGFLLAMSPWVIRNFGVESAPGSSIMANSIAHGSYPDFMYRDQPKSFGFPYRADPAYPTFSQSLGGVLRHISNEARAQPGKYTAWYLVGKPAYFLSWGNVQAADIQIYPTRRTPYSEDLRFALLRTFSLWLHWPLMVLGLAGALLALLRPTTLRLDGSALLAARLVAFLVLYAIGLHMVAAPFPRYSIPFRPLLFALAGLTVRSIWLAVPGVRALFGKSRHSVP